MDEVLELPVLGPGSASPGSPQTTLDMSGGGSTLAPCTDLAGALSWATSTPCVPLAASLHWSCAETDHPQQTIRIGDAEVEVDAALAPLIGRLNALGCHSLASCVGSSEVWSYVMFTERGGREFQKFWHRQGTG